MTAPLADLQLLVGGLRRRLGMVVSPTVALLDAAAELGELSGAYLKDCGYAPAARPVEPGDAPPSARVRAEYGDALFALLSFAEAAGLSAADELAATLARYEERFAVTAGRCGDG